VYTIHWRCKEGACVSKINGQITKRTPFLWWLNSYLVKGREQRVKRASNVFSKQKVEWLFTSLKMASKTCSCLEKLCFSFLAILAIGALSLTVASIGLAIYEATTGTKVWACFSSCGNELNQLQSDSRKMKMFHKGKVARMLWWMFRRFFTVSHGRLFCRFSAHTIAHFKDPFLNFMNTKSMRRKMANNLHCTVYFSESQNLPRLLWQRIDGFRWVHVGSRRIGPKWAFLGLLWC